jgi:hypothetical protein
LDLDIVSSNTEQLDAGISPHRPQRYLSASLALLVFGIGNLASPASAHISLSNSVRMGRCQFLVLAADRSETQDSLGATSRDTTPVAPQVCDSSHTSRSGGCASLRNRHSVKASYSASAALPASPLFILALISPSTHGRRLTSGSSTVIPTSFVAPPESPSAPHLTSANKPLVPSVVGG